MKSKQQTEVTEQIGFCNWLRDNNIPFYHIPNGGRRSPQEAAKFKKMGVSSGVPDICIPVPCGTYHGLYIEMKRVRGGVLSESQKKWFNILEGEGYFVKEAKGAIEAIDIYKYYINLNCCVSGGYSNYDYYQPIKINK